MIQGLYVIFEGNEGTGKSSTMRAVADHFKDSLDPLLTQHPGSTPLGAHLRQLVKYPHTIDPNIVLDPLSRQCLYMADTINFVELILKPSLSANKTVFADRSTFISGLVYGTADNIDPQEMYKLLQLINPPRADRLYIFECPWEVSKLRIAATRKGDTDHYDNQTEPFFRKIDQKYSTLLTGSHQQLMMVSRVAPLDSVVYVNADQPQSQVVKYIVDDINKLISSITTA